MVYLKNNLFGDIVFIWTWGAKTVCLGRKGSSISPTPASFLIHIPTKNNTLLNLSNLPIPKGHTLAHVWSKQVGFQLLGLVLLLFAFFGLHRISLGMKKGSRVLKCWATSTTFNNMTEGDKKKLFYFNFPRLRCIMHSSFLSKLNGACLLLPLSLNHTPRCPHIHPLSKLLLHREVMNP